MKFFPLQRYFGVLARLFRHLALRLLHLFLRWGSLAVNYSIYYFRRLVLRQSEQQARRLSDEAYKKYLDGKEQQAESAIRSDGTSAVSVVAAKISREIFMPKPLTDDNRHVNSLWIGNTLSKIELLTLHSFIAQGHTFHLWTYEKLLTELPEGVVIEDANEILPRETVFRYNNVNKYGHGKGSVSGFSDIFRYKLLYDKGGWWTDMDVTCLKPLNFSVPYFFRKHHHLELVGNVMKAPVQSELMLSCYHEALTEVNENNTDWHKPIEILNKYVLENNLQHYVYPYISNHDDWNRIVGYVVGNEPIPEQYYFIHWMNEEWRSRDIDKNHFRYRSVLGQQMLRFGLLPQPATGAAYFFNDLKHLVFLRIYYYS
jgi:hypothetical protein